MKQEDYSVDYFIRKFEAIPDEQWTVRHCTDYMGRHCALGHCGGEDVLNGNLARPSTPESVAIFTLLGGNVTAINDGYGPYKHRGETPRARILQALHDIKLQQEQAAEKKKQLNPITSALAKQLPCHHLPMFGLCVYCGCAMPVERKEQLI